MRTTLTALLLATTTGLATGATAADELTFGTAQVALHPINQRVLVPWADRVNEQANGVLEIKPRHGQMLVNSVNYIDRVDNGVVELAWGMLVFNPGRFPKSLVSSVPFIEGSAEAGAIAFCNLYEQGVFGDEFKGLKVLFFVPFPQSSIHVNGSDLTTMSDIAGLKIMVGSPTTAAIVSAFGGTPLSTPLPDHYQSLQRGAADGNLMTYTAFPAFNLHEVTTNHLNIPLGGATGMVFMKQETYDGLSVEAKAVIDANSGCATTREMGTIVDRWEAESMEFVASQQGHTISDITPEEFSKIRDDLAPLVFEGFTSRVEGGQEVLDAWISAMEDAVAEVGR